MNGKFLTILVALATTLYTYKKKKTSRLKIFSAREIVNERKSLLELHYSDNNTFIIVYVPLF